jgi:hypothetical protein
LGRAFASRAEQLRGRVFDFYREPAYFPELLDAKSCVLIGGRGTGKTTVLRGLSYQGQASLNSTPPSEWSYFGVYIRLNTARVQAFRGSELDVRAWDKLFGHYLNILLCEGVVQFLTWFETRTENTTIDGKACSHVGATFGLPGAEDLPSLASGLADARTRLQLFVNNVVDGERPPVSMLGAPLDELMAAVATTSALGGQPFFFLLDEYENLSPGQQRVCNTLIKHAGELYAFKVGVKELGLRSRLTLNDHEQLQAPADYAQIDITERLRRPGVFREFARRISNDRLASITAELDVAPVALEDLLPGLTEDAEADLLGVAEATAVVRAELAEALDRESLAAFDALPPLFQYMFGFWARGRASTVVEHVREFERDRDTWTTRYGNYKHALLYTLRAGRRGVRKYYTGFETFSELAGTNLRFFLQLVEEALRVHLGEAGSDAWLTAPIAPQLQTDAATTVGQRNLVELEGLSLIGPRLTRLSVGLGRVFQVMAWRPEGHAPEVTQFRVSDLPEGLLGEEQDLPDPRELSLDARDDGRGLLAEAITHLALIRFPGTKLSGSYTREDDYMLHPIFAPVFSYSHRRKRKMTLSAEQLVGLVTSPSASVASILHQSGRIAHDDDLDLADQLNLFDRYLRIID